MSGKVRQRTAANAPDSTTLSVNERILKECHSLYTDDNTGLIKIAKCLGLKLLAPRKKINILLLGNHSAGKSSFVNWYIEEHVQKTGVAIETQGFTFVTSGRKRESLTGNATLHLYPHFKPLAEHKGVMDYLNTEISTSKQKKFSLITFIDTPGLVDGDMKYPFDVNETILWLGNVSDLIFIFFDPIGQALCKRTLNLVERLNETHGDRMRYYLSKADEAGHESDRQRVLMQIVQELCKRPGLNRTGFDMPTIYIPSANKPSRCVNQIEEVCKDVEKTINQTIQTTLNALERDCEQIAQMIDEKIVLDSTNASYNFRARGKGCLFGLCGLLLPLLMAVNFLASRASRDLTVSVLGDKTTEQLYVYLSPVKKLWSYIPADYHLQVLIGMLLFSLLLIFLAKMSTRLYKTLSRKEKRNLAEQKNYVMTVVKEKKKALYREYLQQSAGDFSEL